MSPPSPLSDALANLSGAFGGQLLTPESDSFHQVRMVHNGLIDRSPVVIARCRDTTDIVHAVRLGRAHDLEISIRGGGHNVAGRAVVDGGLMIDLSLMKDVQVDAGAKTARAQGGVTWAEFNVATQAHGLATTGGVVGTTGIAGLTLGGGIGFLMGQHGLTVDNLLSVELVTADGDVVTASAQQQPDLFWALRGGGGNFGVAASFEYQLHPVGPEVTGGLIAYPLSDAAAVISFYREFTKTIPEEMVAFCALVHAPDGSGIKLAALVVGHCGSVEDGLAALQPIKDFGSPVLDTIGPISYCALNGLLDAAYPKGALNYWKSNFMTEIADDAIDTIVAAFGECPTSMSAILLEHLHGAAVRVPVDATAFALRQTGYNCAILGEWLDPADSDSCIAWTRNAYERMLPHMATARYVNYMGDDEAAEAVADAYGPNYQRLRELKRRYDPDNVFHLNQNIPPR